MSTKRLLFLETVAKGFGDLLNKVVFIGGVTLDLYVDRYAAFQNRTQGHQDCILGSLALPDYAYWESLLVERGFVKEASIDQYRHRWSYEGFTLQILVREKETLKFDYRWFDEAIFHAQRFPLPSGGSIKSFSPVYFVAAKIESFLRNGNGDLRTSEDFEDLIFVLDNREQVETEMISAFHEVRTYIQRHFRKFLHDPCLEEGLYYVLPYGVNEGQVQRVMELMQRIAYYAPNLYNTQVAASR